MSEYLWQFTTYNNFGHTVLKSAGIERRVARSHLAYCKSGTRRLVSACDRIDVIAWRHSVDVTTGTLTLTVQASNGVSARANSAALPSSAASESRSALNLVVAVFSSRQVLKRRPVRHAHVTAHCGPRCLPLILGTPRSGLRNRLCCPGINGDLTTDVSSFPKVERMALRRADPSASQQSRARDCGRSARWDRQSARPSSI